jgi:hypothetical protein
MIKAVRKTRRVAYNTQRQLGTLTMFMELFSGQFTRAFKKIVNKFLGRKVISKIYVK